ncbi:MAG: hypothetical protein WBF04_12495 [Candidatus Sulfotelmatobacter sp.]
MKIISTDLARAILLFPINELNPKGLSLTNIFLDFSKRYNFQKFPKHGFDLDDEKALTFEHGSFTTKDGRNIAIKIRMYSDGLVADCWSSTDDAGAFLRDVMGWLKAEYGLSLPDDRAAKEAYLSQLIVTTNKKLGGIGERLEAFAAFLSKRAAEISDTDSGFNVGAIGFWSNDPAKKQAFRFENQVGTNVSEKRFFTTAPFSTKVHLEMLEEFERILG